MDNLESCIYNNASETIFCIPGLTLYYLENNTMHFPYSHIIFRLDIHGIVALACMDAHTCGHIDLYMLTHVTHILLISDLHLPTVTFY